MRLNRMFTIVAIVMSLALAGYAKDDTTHQCAKAKDAACCQADACCTKDAGCADGACCKTAACCKHEDGAKSCDMKDGKACCKQACHVEKKS